MSVRTGQGGLVFPTVPAVARERQPTIAVEYHVAIGASGSSRYEKGGLRIDFDGYEVCVDDRQVALTLLEFKLLRFFVSSPNRALSRAQIVAAGWGRGRGVALRSVDVHVRRLRKRIERDDARPELIRTVRGVGYKFDERGLTACVASAVANAVLNSHAK